MNNVPDLKDWPEWADACLYSDESHVFARYNFLDGRYYSENFHHKYTPGEWSNIRKRIELVEQPIQKTINKYSREIKRGVYVDVYDVLEAFCVTNPATAHAIKKLLAAGERGYKNAEQDLREAISSIERAIELENGL